MNELVMLISMMCQAQSPVALMKQQILHISCEKKMVDCMKGKEPTDEQLDECMEELRGNP